jgi:cytochrome c oxidase subunit 2
VVWGILFHPQSPQTKVMASLLADVLFVSAAVFLIVAGLVSFCLLRYRAAAGAGAEGAPEANPRRHYGSHRIEMIWTAIPVLVLAALFVLTVRAIALIDAPIQPNQPPDLVVTGHQWWWEARYPNGVATTSEIHVPAGRRLLVRVTSADVIHDFWVPELARKMDAVPGRDGYIWLEANEPGRYQGMCSEFCGAQHAWMHFVVIAEPQAKFSEWLESQAQPAREPPSGSASEGARLFQEKKCGECHAIAGASAKGTSGPDLTHLLSREFLGAGISRNSSETLALWLTNPQAAKPGNRMPDAHLSDSEASALSAYLGTLK